MRYEDRFCPKCGDPNPIYLGNDPDYFADSVNEEYFFSIFFVKFSWLLLLVPRGLLVS